MILLKGDFLFKPKFNYTEKIVNNLTFITESNCIILNTPHIQEWEEKLQKETLLRRAHSSTAIEGNLLSLNQVTELSDNHSVMAMRKDKQEVLNYIEALNRIPDFASKDRFELNDLLEIHKILTKETLENPEDEGFLRNCQVFVVDSEGSVVYTPPDSDEVLNLINEFLDWFNSDISINPIITAGLVHCELVRVHPFFEGNGIIARFMAILFLCKQGFDSKRFFALDDYYNMNRHRYYDTLQSVNQDNLNSTKWLEYFTEGMVFTMESIREKVIELNKDIESLKEEDHDSLNERQKEIVEKIKANGRINNKDIREMFSISNTTARKDTNQLVNLNVIIKKGKGKNTYYILA